MSAPSFRIIEGTDDSEMCAACGAQMAPGAKVADVDTTAEMPWATAEWATVHAKCVR